MIKAKYPTGNEYILKSMKPKSGVLKLYLNDEFYGIICMSELIKLIDKKKL